MSEIRNLHPDPRCLQQRSVWKTSARANAEKWRYELAAGETVGGVSCWSPLANSSLCGHVLYVRITSGQQAVFDNLKIEYGTTIAKGKMDTMDLYQFLNRGIPIADEIAKVMGLDVTNAIKEVQKQIKAGKVTSDVFIQAMQNMSAEGSKFGGLMEAQSKTITGQISNIEDAIEQMFNELGKSQEGVINTGLGVVSTLVENWKTVGKVLMTVVAAYGAYKAAVLAMIAISKAQIAWESAKAFISLARSITSAKDAMALFNLVASSNPLGLVLGVIAAGITLFGLSILLIFRLTQQLLQLTETMRFVP